MAAGRRAFESAGGPRQLIREWSGEPDEPDLLEAVVEQAPVAFAFYDADLRYRRVNRVLAELNGVPARDHLGRRPTQVLPSPLGEQVEENLRRVLTSHEVLVDPHFVSGDRTGVRHFTSSWYPALAVDGSLRGVAVFIVDITDLQRSEQALRASQARAGMLLEASERLASALRVDQVLQTMADIGTGMIGADYAGVAVVDERVVRYPRPLGLGGAEELIAEGHSAPTVVSLALRARAPAYIAGPESHLALLPDPEARQFLEKTEERAWAVVPLQTAGAPLGALRLAFRDRRIVDPDERVFLEALAGQCALALERAQFYEREHQAAVALQRSLLPDALPTVDSLDLAFRYVPGQAEAEIGGDWYDAFVLPGGRVAIAVGDVMGKGLPAAACMGRVRSALRAFAFSDPHPQAVLGGLDRVFAGTEADETLATLVYGVVDPGSGAVVLGDAGHLPVVVIRAGGVAELLDREPASTPLGWAEPRDLAQTLQLHPGDTLLAFTDGLVEHRSRTLDVGLQVLVAAAQEHVAVGLESLCDHVLDRSLAGQQRDDDVTLLAVRMR